MENIRLVPADLEIAFDLKISDEQAYASEYTRLSENDDDAIGQWLRVSKARGDVRETDPVVLHLMVELYRKMERLENILMNNLPEYVPMKFHGRIESVGFEHFKLSEPMMIEGEQYYGRFELPVHPKRVSAFYFEALDSSTAKIVRRYMRDEDSWAGYVRARERIMIRHIKGLE